MQATCKYIYVAITIVICMQMLCVYMYYASYVYITRLAGNYVAVTGRKYIIPF